MFTTMDMAIGSAYIAMVMAVWKYASTIYKYILRFFVVTIVIDDTRLENAIFRYIRDECTILDINISDTIYETDRLYVASAMRKIALAYKSNDSNTIYMYNGVPMLLESKSKSTDWNFQLKFFRTTINPDDFILKAMQRYNDVHDSESSGDRFFVENVFGSIGNTRLGDSVECCEKTASTSNKYSMFKEFIGYSHDEVFGEIEQRFELNNLYFPPSVWKSIRNLKRWKNSQNWYTGKSIPWKRGWLLYGPPGTGKSSLVKSIGEYMDMPVISFNLQTFTDVDFIDKWDYVISMSPCIALIEDIDTVFDGRKNITPESGLLKSLSFNCLLNCIDGVHNSDGVLTVITTNNPESIDKALFHPTKGGTLATRPGRIDEAIMLGDMDKTCRTKMAKRILCDCPDRIPIAVEQCNGMTPAQVQSHCEQIALDHYWGKAADK